MPRNCAHCKGTGWVHPFTTKECNFCYNHPAGKKTCCECLGKGWKKIRETSMCMTCDGRGRVGDLVGS